MCNIIQWMYSKVNCIFPRIILGIKQNINSNNNIIVAYFTGTLYITYSDTMQYTVASSRESTLRLQSVSEENDVLREREAHTLSQLSALQSSLEAAQSEVISLQLESTQSNELTKEV